MCLLLITCVLRMSTLPLPLPLIAKDGESRQEDKRKKKQMQMQLIGAMDGVLASSESTKDVTYIIRNRTVVCTSLLLYIGL